MMSQLFLKTTSFTNFFFRTINKRVFVLKLNECTVKIVSRSFKNRRLSTKFMLQLQRLHNCWQKLCVVMPIIRGKGKSYCQRYRHTMPLISSKWAHKIKIVRLVTNFPVQLETTQRFCFLLLYQKPHVFH